MLGAGGRRAPGTLPPARQADYEDPRALGPSRPREMRIGGGSRELLPDQGSDADSPAPMGQALFLAPVSAWRINDYDGE